MTQQTKVLQNKGTLQVIRRVVPIRQDIAYSFCFTGAETEIHKIKDNSKIIMQTNLDRRGLRTIPIICHNLDPPSFSLPTTFKGTGSRQPESRGVWNMSNCPNLARTAAIEVCLPFNFAVVFDFTYFLSPPVKQNE